MTYTSTSESVVPPTELSDTVRDRLDHWFDDSDVVAPSINYGVFDRNGVIYQHGIGEFQLDGRTPQLDTIYRIASMSKSFSIACVLVLRDRGLLALSDDVRLYVPEFTTYVDGYGDEVVVTIEMLMNNSSGLPEDNGWADHELGLSRDEFLAFVDAGLAFADVPGVGYQYSNAGFWLLSIIVENVTGQTFPEFARTTLLEPLGLTSTRYDARDYADSDTLGRGAGGTNIARGYGTFDEGTTWFERPFVGSGIGGSAASMFSTIPDIARWVSWLSSAFNEVVTDAERADDLILSRASRRLMQRMHTSVPSSADRAADPDLEGLGYGLGLAVENDIRFGAMIHHSGGLPGFSSNMRWHRSSGIGVVVFSNTNGVRPSIPAAGMLRAVLEHLDVPARTITLWPTTVAAAAAIDAAITGSGQISDADGALATQGNAEGDATTRVDPGAEDARVIFSPNLLSDVPAAVRDDRLAEVIAKVGGLRATSGMAPPAERISWAVSAAHVAWTIPGATGDIECRIEMTPTTPSMVQRLDILTLEPLTRLSPVTRYYRP
jgi:CubicO group peptidase (beta-lactamase class C family)